MSSYTLLILTASSTLSAILIRLIWQRDVFFAIFFSMFVLYSVVAQWGYYLVPELSEIILRMHFGEEALAPAVVFTGFSLLALFAGYGLIYRPLIRKESFRLIRTSSRSEMFLAAYAISLVVFAVIYFTLRDQLDYSNASDESFLEAAGPLYSVFWQFYKFSVFGLLVSYALLRNRIYRSAASRQALWLMFGIHAGIFAAATVSVGSRTDPLALLLGMIGFELYARKVSVLATQRRVKSYRRLPLGKIIIGSAIALAAMIWLESHRSGGSTIRDDVDASTLAQAILLKDYYTPFHVLIGAMHHDYVAPVTAITSNIANSLMFLGVDYLQFFVVEQWSPGTVTRSSSPALFAFAEGYVMFGWMGFLYNGAIWAAGIGLWRKLSRTNDEGFNAFAFSITFALAATIARSQSSYLIKDIYLWFLPALALYALAAGLTPAMRRRKTALVSS